jgi:hypothetical protein
MERFWLSRAIMDLIAETQGLRIDPEVMASRLGVTPDAVRRELQWLEDQGMLLPAPRRVDPPGGKERIRLFISHGAEDTGLASALVDLLVVALGLGARAIRCSDVPGYKFDGGDEIDTKLKAEVHDADAFIGVISAKALQRLYVTFELGARWGSRRPLVPLLAPGLLPDQVGAPLNALNALRIDLEEDLHHLVSQLARTLTIEAQPASVYLPALRRLNQWREPGPVKAWR